MSSQYEIRAIPAMGFSHRWCAQRPWGKSIEVVTIVDVEAPRAKSDDGEPLPRYATKRLPEGKIVYDYGSEITVLDLEELRKDPHISVAGIGGAIADADEINATKALALKLQGEIFEARKEHQGAIEDMKAAYTDAKKDADDAAAKIAELQAQLAAANAARAPKGK